MERVSDLNIPCPICSKSDWCLLAPDGSAAICARISKGSVKRSGNAGWLHILDKDKFNPNDWTPMEKTAIDFTAQVEQYRQELRTNQDAVRKITDAMGIELGTAYEYDCGFDGTALTIPAHDENHVPIGIQRRFIDGTKRMVKGGRVGIFRPWFPPYRKTPAYMICEGFSDTATASELDWSYFHCIGKMNCNSGNDIIVKMLQREKGRAEVVLISDRDKDDVGVQGAINTAVAISDYCWSIKLIVPPPGIKDLREWRKDGLTSEDLLHEIATTKNFLD